MLGMRRTSPAYICGMHSNFLSLHQKKRFVLVGSVLVFALGLTSCGESGSSYEVTENHTAGTSDLTMARLDVSGMMCAHACGGKIKKELLKVEGVANASIEFEENRDLNYAEVEYDAKTVELSGLVEAIAGIADGKLYAVEAVEVTHFAKGAQLN
jgi:copper chaperone CopZ